MLTHPIRLGVNIDHVATLRQVRGAPYPDPLYAALVAEQAGADSITLHLREDRRHIQDHDVRRMRAALQTRMNLEMAAQRLARGPLGLPRRDSRCVNDKMAAAAAARQVLWHSDERRGTLAEAFNNLIASLTDVVVVLLK